MEVKDIVSHGVPVSQYHIRSKDIAAALDRHAVSTSLWKRGH
ncbi:hypothetical protein AALD01_02860 [Oscillospiraceae bacterium 21-37]